MCSTIRGRMLGRGQGAVTIPSYRSAPRSPLRLARACSWATVPTLRCRSCAPLNSFATTTACLPLTPLSSSPISCPCSNRPDGSFADFLGALSSEKRKNLRKERARAQDGVEIRQLTGDAIRPEHWDAFWVFYQDTGARKWGRPYLTRTAFDLIGERMADKVLLVLAFDGDEPVAGALNFIGSDALYGRYWGAVVEKPFLHFELCYYQAIDAAIALGLSRVEAGAQGGHKLARGYEPVRTWSAHYIADPNFRSAVADFLERERAGIAQDQIYLGERTPFRKG